MTLPHAFDLVPALCAARARAGHLFVGLDYDGTLTPIVARPEDAALEPHTRAVLARLAARTDTVVAVLSGRALADVRARVSIPHLHYAGNHGLEIEGPAVHELHPAARAAAPVLAAIAAQARRVLAGVPGALVEDKGASLSVHYRLVADAQQEHVRSLVHSVVAGQPGVRMSEGKKVVEVRPDVDWHKGTALQFLRAALHEAAAAPALFIGDDVTDEDAFAALGPAGCGVIVADPGGRPTAARARLRDPVEVVRFLALLADDRSDA